MRWAWRGFAVLGVLALLAGLGFLILREVRLHQEVSYICRQFTSVDCKYHPDGSPEPRDEGLQWDPETGRYYYGPTPTPSE